MFQDDFTMFQIKLMFDMLGGTAKSEQNLANLSQRNRFHPASNDMIYVIELILQGGNRKSAFSFISHALHNDFYFPSHTQACYPVPL